MANSSGHTFQSTLTDLMTSLAVIFILLLVVFLKQAHDQSKNTKDKIQEQLKELLVQQKLQLRPDAEDPLSLNVAVGEDILRFPLGSAALSAQGREFVADFFSDFSKTICAPDLRSKIDSIVIEGHTDRSGEKTGEGVKNNIALSQRRSYSVLEQALAAAQSNPEHYECLLKLSSASGRGSRTPVMSSAGEYLPDQSRRVQIRIRVKSAEQALKEQLEQKARPSG